MTRLEKLLAPVRPRGTGEQLNAVRDAETGGGALSRRLAAGLIVAAAAAAAALVVTVVLNGRQPRLERAAAPSASNAPVATGPFRAVLPDGQTLTSADLPGRPTVVGFVIEDCASCVATLRTLAALNGSGVRTIAMNVNTSGIDPALAARRLERFGRVVGARGPIFAADPGIRTARAYGIRQIESFLLFDARGREIGRGIGLGAAQIRRALAKAA